MIRAVVGTNSVDCCARICHSPTAWGDEDEDDEDAQTTFELEPASSKGAEKVKKKSSGKKKSGKK